MTWGKATLARSFSSPGVRLPRGWGSTAKEYSGIPKMRDMVRAVGTKGSVQRTAVGIPSFSKVMPSCKLHDEQDPQSPLEVTRTSQREAKSFTISSGHGRDAFGLEPLITVAKL